MSDLDKEKMLDLLSAKAITGLSEKEEEKLKKLEKVFPELKEDFSFELTAAAIGLINLTTDEPVPPRLRNRILADADSFFAAENGEASNSAAEEVQKAVVFEPSRSVWQSLGWVVAAVACVALAVNLWMTRTEPRGEIAQNPPAQITPTPNLAEQRRELLASANDIVRENWTDIDPKQPRNIQGDVVWSNSRQKGFVRFRNLPVNDKSKEAYQLWIFDETQKYPVDGGVFNADETGEIIVPIDPRVKVKKPTMFAVTAEKPGGVVVSEREKVMAVAKLET